MGAVDRTTITLEASPLVISPLRAILASHGIDVQEVSASNLRCIRLKRIDESQVVVDGNVSSSEKAAVDAGTNSEDPAKDIGDEVRFRVEPALIGQSGDTYSLDICPLKRSLQSCTYLYGTIRK
ncbi:hypothetical protein PENSPDRAFT_679428 [Peniophora sp. CONT]|nr:hypothetical protein PENSPDRAFT_679428 [Peniophora sp. CONT]